MKQMRGQVNERNGNGLANKRVISTKSLIIVKPSVSYLGWGEYTRL